MKKAKKLRDYTQCLYIVNGVFEVWCTNTRYFNEMNAEMTLVEGKEGADH